MFSLFNMSDKPNQTSEATRGEPIPGKTLHPGPITIWRYNIHKRDNADDLVLTGRTHGYVESRSAFDTYHETLDSRVADLPSFLQAFKRNPEAIEPLVENLELPHVDTSTVEYHGPRDGEFSYEVSHRSPGPFSTGRDIEASWGRNPIQRYMPVAPDAWADLGRGKYLGEDVTRVHLEDVRRGEIPDGPYTVHAREQEANDIPSLPQERGLTHYVSYDGFMESDSVLMKTGSPENREILAGIYFRKSDGQIDHNLIIEGPNFRQSIYIERLGTTQPENFEDGRMHSDDSLKTTTAVAGLLRVYFAFPSVPETCGPGINPDGNEMNFVGLKQD